MCSIKAGTCTTCKIVFKTRNVKKVFHLWYHSVFASLRRCDRFATTSRSEKWKVRPGKGGLHWFVFEYCCSRDGEFIKFLMENCLNCYPSINFIDKTQFHKLSICRTLNVEIKWNIKDSPITQGFPVYKEFYISANEWVILNVYRQIRYVYDPK